MSKEVIKVFCFMICSDLVLLLPDGTLLNKMPVDSIDEAKDILQRETTNQSITDKLQTGNFSTLWFDDPAGDEEVVEACRLMEEKEKEPTTPQEIDCVAVRTIGTVFFFVRNKENPEPVNVVSDGRLLNVGDICTFRARKPVVHHKELFPAPSVRVISGYFQPIPGVVNLVRVDLSGPESDAFDRLNANVGIEEQVRYNCFPRNKG